MFEYVQGNILNSDAEALVNTVNCVGVMGRGIALQFKKKWPDNFSAYAAACRKGEVVPGRMFVFETRHSQGPRYIINFPTKRHWRMPSRMADIESGLHDLRNVIVERGIRSIAIPPLGSGLGKLPWPEVKRKIAEALSPLSNVKIFIYEPSAKLSSQELLPVSPKPAMTSGRAVLVKLMDHYLNGWLDTSITLIEIHKLMYFMQVAGEPLRLRFSKGIYGPYASNLRHVLILLEGHFIKGYGDGGDLPLKPIALMPGIVAQADEALAGHVQTTNRFKSVCGLIDGFESPEGLELLATAHWLAAQEGASTIDEIQEGFSRWNAHKRKFSKRQIEIAARTLSEQGWLKLADEGDRQSALSDMQM